MRDTARRRCAGPDARRIVSIAEAYALLGDPFPYVSRKTRGNVTTVTVRLKAGGRTRCKVEAERVGALRTWRIKIDRFAVGSPKRAAASIIVRDVLNDGGAS